MQKHKIRALLKAAVIAGNIVYILWIVFNAIDSGFTGTLVEIVTLSGLVVLLSFNIYFLFYS